MNSVPRGTNQLDSPWIQAGRLAFIALYAVTVLAALAWALSNVRQIDPQNRALVLHFGALARVQNAGLLLAWPRPFEQVVLLPAADRVLERRIEGLLRSEEAVKGDRVATLATPLNDALAYAYVLQGEHVLPALDRLVTRSAVSLAGARDLDTILVARPELLGNDHQAAEQRERLRGDLLQSINRRLSDLAASGQGIGVQITRVDVQSSLPEPAVSAFNAVLTASQQADKEVANARTEAEKLTQNANQQADRTLQVAHAQASERLALARAQTATVQSLAQAQRNGTDPQMLLRIYRERLPQILGQAGSVTTVDPQDDARLIIQGAEQ
ncbi:hypothetical protein AO265_12245 [Pseudomonas sp. ABAC61]|nr:hypothetical protein AO265_12245 [Pseudomonas sp. ABAC61]